MTIPFNLVRGPSLGQAVDVVVGGPIISQALTLYTTPVIYLFMEQLSQRLRGRGKTTRIPAGA